MVWRQLQFNNEGVATNFEEKLQNPILGFAAKTVDVAGIVGGAFLPGSISNRIEKAYDKHLYKGATLQDLPNDDEGPRFVFLATNLTNGALWRFSKPYMRDWKSEAVDLPKIPLAKAVAASSAFPPFLSPTLLDIPGRSPLQLTDGGVYDNLGVEPVLKNCRTIFISDGGGTFNQQSSPKKDWFRGTLRVLNTVDVQVRRLRRREVMSLLVEKQRDGAFWAINTVYESFLSKSPLLDVDPEVTRELSLIPTRLAKVESSTRNQLVNWGYSVCDAAIRSYVAPGLPPPLGLPFPENPLTPMPAEPNRGRIWFRRKIPSDQ